MDAELAQKSHEKLSADNNFCRKTSYVFGAIALICALGWYSKDQIVVVDPPQAIGQYKISETKASVTYKVAWAMSMANLVGNMSPTEAPYIINQLSYMFSPGIENQTRKSLYAYIELLKKKKVETQFTSKEIYYDPETDQVFVYGDMRLKSLVNKSPTNIKYTFVSKVSISSYKPAIQRFDFYEGKPKTSLANKFDLGSENAK